jgi:hypothetical protein
MDVKGTVGWIYFLQNKSNVSSLWTHSEYVASMQGWEFLKYQSKRSQEVEAPWFQHQRHLKVVRSSLPTGRF